MTEPGAQALKGRVQGKVQGVFYRASMQREARALGLSGWVCNLADGSVAFFVQGDHLAINLLLDWARQGPPSARVTHLDTEAAAAEPDRVDFAMLV